MVIELKPHLPHGELAPLRGIKETGRTSQVLETMNQPTSSVDQELLTTSKGILLFILLKGRVMNHSELSLKLKEFLL
jgi:hypothetical protein